MFRSIFARGALLASLGLVFALAQPSPAAAAGSSSISWGAQDSPAGWGAAAVAGGMVAAQALSAPQEMAKLPASLPMPQSSIVIERPRPMTAQERREQDAADAAIRKNAPWTASWATLRAPLNADEDPDPRAAWARIMRQMGAKPLPEQGDAFVAVGSGSLEAGVARAQAISRPQSIQSLSQGAMAASAGESATVGASSLFRGSADENLAGLAQASFSPSGAARVAWSAKLSQAGGSLAAAGETSAPAGRAIWIGFFSRGALWIMGVSPRSEARPER